MSGYTNTGLVEHVKKALALKTKYMWAGTLSPITDAYIAQKLKQVRDSGVPASRSGYTDARVKELNAIAGKGYYGVDCVCLVKSYLWGGVDAPKYTASNDVNANIMYDMAKEKGPIGTMPDVPGLVLYSKTHPHVGVYIGNGETIESTLGARGDGVVKRKLDDFWEYWMQCPFIEYVDLQANAETKKRRLAYPAVVRESASSSSKRLDRLVAGRKVDVVVGSETKDPKSGITYVRITGTFNGWITESALEK